MRRYWYAVKAKPRRELQATSVLTERGVEVYLPQVPTQRRPGQSANALQPLFPGYLFARVALASPEWVVARSAPGVAYFVGSAGVPSPLPEALVEGIRTRADALRRAGWQSLFHRGDRVVIHGGPLSGLDAIFDHTLSPSGRVRVFLQLISRTVPVNLDVALLRST